MEVTSTMVIDKAAFAAYRALRQIADDYKIDLEPPRIVFVGETSAGKSMLVQTFLGFPCTFTSTGVATRCPVAYQLRYNPHARSRRVIKPEGIQTKDLANHIGQHMKHLERKRQFSFEPYRIEIESDHYPDLEILDVPGVVAGQNDPNVRDAVERITEFYVRNPKFIIILVVDTNQEVVNRYGGRVVADLCKGTLNKGSNLPPRQDYQNNMCTIDTKFDIFMANNRDGRDVNRLIKERLETPGDAFFVSMVFDARSMADNTFESNEQYITELPQLEKHYVDQWIRDINQNAKKSTTSNEEFDPKYRSLIGINIVRQQIQKRWLKAFYQAVPTLRATLAQQLTYAHDKYEAVLNEWKLVDPTLIRESYLSYLNDFRKTIGQYASYTAEILNYFPVHKCGTTYEEVEMGFYNWSRRQPLVWRAYMNDAQLKQHAYIDDHYDQDFIDNLNLKLVGGSQFGRLHRIFAYMVLARRSGEVTRDEIVTIESYLAGGLSTSPNMEKCMRDLLYRGISQTFAIGIPWCAQMHTYLCDTFRINVTRWLLSQKQYAYLVKHTSFLSLVELDFHRKMRTMLTNAIKAVRSARLSYSVYVQHDVTAWLKKLTFRIPSEIPHGFYDQIVPNLYVKNKTTTTKIKIDNQNDTFREATIGEIFANIKKPQLLDVIFGSDAYLTNKRDPRTGSHHDNARKIVQELYEVTCGRLIDDINRNFNANLITHVVNYNQVEKYAKRSIANQLVHASDMDISHMANVEPQKLVQTLAYWKQQIGDLTKASVLLDSVTQQLIGENTTDDVEIDHLKAHAEKSAQLSIEILDNQRDHISKSFKTMSTTDSKRNETTANFENIDGEDQEAYEDRFLFHTIDPVTSEVFIRRIYQHHDLEDLRSSLLEGDELDQDTNALKAEEHINSTSIPTMNRTNELLRSTQNPGNKLEEDQIWKQNGLSLIGENDPLSRPCGLFIDDNDHSIYIADCDNDRIIQLKFNNGIKVQSVAGGNGRGSQINQLRSPVGVIIDHEKNALIIADRGNKRVIEWSLENSTTQGQILHYDTKCWGLTMDKYGSLYVCDTEKQEVRQWKRGEMSGAVVAGGNGQGDQLNQLNFPTYLFIDDEDSLYISDSSNHRVMKWIKDAKEGIIVAGGNGQGNSLSQLHRPTGVIVDRFGQIYVNDNLNYRVMKWTKGGKKGIIIVGGNGQGNGSNQFYYPEDLSFDREGNLYVSDCFNHRIQKFEIA